MLSPPHTSKGENIIMSVNPRHRRISKSNVETILNSLEENHRNAQSQRTSNSGSHFIPSGDLDENGFPTGQGTIIGGGAKGGGISPWVNDTTPPGKPEGLKVFSESSIIFVTWDGSLQGGTPPDFDHVSVFVDGVEKATFSAAGTYPTDSYEPDSVHKVTARSWDDAHDADGSSKPNGSEFTDPMEVVVKSAVDVGQIEDAQNKAQEALDKIAGVSSTADKASKDASAAQSAADDARVEAGKASAAADKADSKADTALTRGVELVRNPSFNPDNGDLDGFGLSMGSTGAPAEPPSPYTTYGALTKRDYFSSWRFPLDRDRKYRFGFWCICDGKGREDLRIGWRYVDSHTHWDEAVTVTQEEASSWVWREAVASTPDKWNDTDHSMSVWLNIAGYGDKATGWWITGLTIRDVTESWNAQKTADGKNRIFTSANEPSHNGLAKGDLWMQLNADGHVNGIQVWNGSAFEDYVLMAQQVLVAGSVGTVSLSDGAVTADKVTASEALLEKLLVRKIKADEIDVGSLSAAIVQSGRFVTPDGLTGFDETGFWVKNPNGGYDFSASHNGVSITGELQTGRDDASHCRIKNVSVDTPNGEKRSTGVIEFYSYRDPKHPIGALTGWDTGAVSQLVLGESFDDITYRNGSITVSSINTQNSLDKTSVDIFSNYNMIHSTPLNNNHNAVVVVESDNEQQRSKVQINADEVQLTGDIRENDINHYHADRRILTWSSTWTGAPGNGQFIEYEINYNVITPGEGQWFISNTGARVGGTGEYAISFRITDNNTNNIVYNNRNITPPKNGGVDNFTYSNMFFLPNGYYHIQLITEHFGSVTINMGNADDNFHDETIASGAFVRYATITRI